MVGEVVQELLGHHQHGIEEFLHLGVPDLGVGEYLPDEVYGPLDLKVVSQVLPFNDQGDAYHVVAGHDVEDVEAAAFVHQHLGEALLVDDGVDGEWVTSRSGDMGGMVPLIERD